MDARHKAMPGEILALPFYALMDLFLDLPWVAVALGGAAVAGALVVLS
jgi:hypothetical protein